MNLKERWVVLLLAVLFCQEEMISTEIHTFVCVYFLHTYVYLCAYVHMIYIHMYIICAFFIYKYINMYIYKMKAKGSF